MSWRNRQKRLRATPRVSRQPPPAGAPSTQERGDRALRDLFQISKLFLGAATVEDALDAALAVAAGSLALKSAIVTEARAGAARMIVWRSPDETSEGIARAKARVADAHAYLVGTPLAAAAGLAEEAGATPLALASAPSSSAGPAAGFVDIPLVVGRAPPFGVFQLETHAQLSEPELFFVNAIANQLAVALDRQLAWRGEVAKRVRYEALVDNLDQAFVWEADGDALDLRYASARAATLLGYSVRELTTPGRWWTHVVHPEDKEELHAMFQRVAVEGFDARADHRCVTAEGRVRWFHTGVHRMDADSEHLHLQAVSLDVTDARMAADYAREQLDFTRTLAASLGEGVVAVDVGGKVTFVNDAAEDLLGCAWHDVRGKALEDVARFRSSTTGVELPSPLARAMQTKRTHRSEDRLLIRNDAHAFPISFAAAPIRSAGDVTGAVLVFQDISERRESDEARAFLANATKLLDATLDYTEALKRIARLAVPRLGEVCLIDLMSGAGAEGALQRVAWAHVDPAIHSVLDGAFGEGVPTGDLGAGLAQVVESGIAEIVDHVDERWSPALAPVDTRALRSVLSIPVRLGRSALGAVTFAFATSGRHHGTPELRLAEELAERIAFAVENGRLYANAQDASRVREQILGVVSHDLRGPLAAILLTANSITRRGIADERALRSMDRIASTALRMSRLIDDLLDFASIEAGHLSIKLSLEDPAAILEDAVTHFEAVAADHKLTISSTVAPDLPRVSCDRDRVLQLLGNLLGNAMKLTPPGGAVKLRAVQSDGDVLFSVEDTGPGIPKTQLKLIFDRYWRGGATTHKSAGLGLAISKGIVEAHGGRIWAESELGHGATVFFTVPITG